MLRSLVGSEMCIRDRYNPSTAAKISTGTSALRGPSATGGLLVAIYWAIWGYFGDGYLWGYLLDNFWAIFGLFIGPFWGLFIRLLIGLFYQ